MRINKLNILLMTMILFFVGFTMLPKETTTPRLPVTIAPLNQTTPTHLPITKTLPPEPIIEPTWTMPARLPVNDGLSKIKELLQTNGSCQLPCWWGIIPGETKWEDARNVLFPLIDSIPNDQINNGSRDVSLFFPYFENGAALVQGYTIKNNIVEEIAVFFNKNLDNPEIKSPDFGPFSKPVSILRTYGVPDEVYLGGTYQQDINWQSFWIYLYYTKQRIFVEYDQGMQNPQYPSKLLTLCFSESEIEHVELHVWGANHSFDRTLNLIFRNPGHSVQHIEKVTNLTIDQFYKNFINSDGEPCIDTPAKYWLR